LQQPLSCVSNFDQKVSTTSMSIPPRFNGVATQLPQDLWLAALQKIAREVFVKYVVELALHDAILENDPSPN
jgi:hypothetical protein